MGSKQAKPEQVGPTIKRIQELDNDGKKRAEISDILKTESESNSLIFYYKPGSIHSVLERHKREQKELVKQESSKIRWAIHNMVSEGINEIQALGMVAPELKGKEQETIDLWVDMGLWPVPEQELKIMSYNYKADPDYRDVSEQDTSADDQAPPSVSPENINITQPKEGTTDTGMTPNTVITQQDSEPTENANSSNLRAVLNVNADITQPETEPVNDVIEKDVIEGIMEMHEWWSKHKEEIRNPAPVVERGPIPAVERRPLLKRMGKTDGIENSVTKTVRLARDLAEDVVEELKKNENREKYDGSLSGLVETLLWQWLGADPKYLVNPPERKGE